MKKFITDIKILAALLMAGAAFTACSSSDEIIDEQPQNPTEPQVYTMVIKASKGGDTTTRALQPGTDSETGKPTVDAYWSGDETIEVYQNGEKIGEATAAASPNGNTTITATLTSAPVPTDDLIFYLGGSTIDYTGQVGLLTGTGSISEKYDYASDCLTSGSFTVDDINNKVIPNENNSRTLEFGAAEQAIIKFTLLDKADGTTKLSPSAFTVTDGNSTVELTNIPDATYSANGAGVLYVAFPPGAENTTITLTATVGDDIYTYTTSSPKTFYRGQYYEITVKMTKNENARPLTLEAIENGTITVDFVNGLTLPKPITYTKNGVAGDPITTTTDIDVSAGDKVCLYSKNSALGYYTEEDGTRDDHYINILTSNRCYIYGNVMSLIDDSGSGFANDKVIVNTAEQHTTFYRLFENAQFLENHQTKPILLPATTLTMDCYSEMFSCCRSLTTAPELPAETLADGCYSWMFSECNSLTTAPELPATKLADNCYFAMFAECTSLTTAPMLRATTLADGCCGMMFQGCTKLNYVKCLATDISADWCLYLWLDGVSATGTFVMASGVTWPEGTSGIPSDWTVTTE